MEGGAVGRWDLPQNAGGAWRVMINADHARRGELLHELHRIPLIEVLVALRGNAGCSSRASRPYRKRG